MDKGDLDHVMPRIYEELRRLAGSYMRRERGSHTLQPTALLHETYIRLIDQHSVDFTNRAQVLGVAAQMMRRILANHGQAKSTAKRGGELTLIQLGAVELGPGAPAVVFDELDEALDRLAALDPRQAKVVELRVFGGLTAQEAAEFLGISVATAQRDWASGRLWLARELTPRSAQEGPAPEEPAALREEP